MTPWLSRGNGKQEGYLARKKKYRGHYCWACGRIRPNERFSGGGHKQHVCCDCQKLGSEELAYRQAVRDIDRCLDFGCGIRRKSRKTFDQFLSHSNPRIRGCAQRIKEDLEAERKEWQDAIAADGDAVGEPSEHDCLQWDDLDHDAAIGGYEEIPF